MSQNSNNETDKKDFLGKVTVLLGIVATSLGIFISSRTHIISEQTQNILGKINELEVINKDLDNKLKSLEIDKVSREVEKTKPRIEKQFLVLNAKAFTNRIESSNVQIIWLDKQIEDDIRSYVNSWKEWNSLMTGSGQTGLFLRQVVCLRIINIGGTPARDISITIRKKGFNNSKGDNLEQPYYGIDTSNWIKEDIPIPDLMEMDFKDQLKTEILIPLAHVSRDDRSFRYFGSMAVPIKISWYDKQDLPRASRSFQINLSKESTLKSDLDSILGLSKY